MLIILVQDGAVFTTVVLKVNLRLRQLHTTSWKMSILPVVIQTSGHRVNYLHAQ